MRTDHITQDLHLLLVDGVCAIIDFNIGLKGFFKDALTVAIFNFDDDLERKLLQSRDLVSKIAGVLINWNPDAHGMSLHQAV